jgi:tetratricopeptide (TPR) repeat protein
MGTHDIELTLEKALARSAALSDAGQHAQALQCLDAAGDAAPHCAQWHSARGWALENLGAARLVQARAAYEAALALDSCEPWALLGLASVLGQLGLEDQSVGRLKQALDAAVPRTQEDLALLELVGWCHYRLGALDAACRHFEQALGTDADWLSVRLDLALVLLLQGRTEEALGQYGLCVAALDAPGGSARIGIAMVAVDDIDDALRRWPTMPAGQAAVARAQLEAAIARHAVAPEMHGDE